VREAGGRSHLGDADLVEAALAEQPACGVEQFVAVPGAVSFETFLPLFSCAGARTLYAAHRGVDINRDSYHDTVIVMYIMITVRSQA
jgi:hypothetical protein